MATAAVALQTSTPAFADALADLRRVLWDNLFSFMLPGKNRFREKWLRRL